MIKFCYLFIKRFFKIFDLILKFVMIIMKKSSSGSSLFEYKMSLFYIQLLCILK